MKTIRPEGAVAEWNKSASDGKCIKEPRALIIFNEISVKRTGKEIGMFVLDLYSIR